MEENLPSSDLPEDLVTVPVFDSNVHHEKAPKQPCPDPVSNEHVDPDHQSPQKLEQQLKESKKKIASLKKKLKLCQQKNRRLSRKVTSLQDITKQLSEHNMISSNCEEMLSQTFSGVPLAMMKRMSKKSQGKDQNTHQK